MHLSDEVLPLVLEARHIKKASTYLDDAMLGKDGRMHPRYTYLPKTGRLSSKRPIVMNFPQGRKGDVLKRAAQKIRENILPPPGMLLAEFDWNAIEALLTGFFADNPDYMLAAEKGVHDIFGSHLLYRRGGIPSPKGPGDPDFSEWQEWFKTNHKQVRAISKKRIYAGSYGQGVMSMSKDLGIPVKEVKELDEVFERMAPKVVKWQNDTLDRAHAEGQLTNPFGYSLSFFNVYDTKDGKILVDSEGKKKKGREANEALAFGPQSTCAAMLRDTLVTLGFDPDEGKKFELLIPTHDSILFAFWPQHRDEVLTKVRTLMEEEWPELGGLRVKTECKVGKNGKEMEVVK